MTQFSIHNSLILLLFLFNRSAGTNLPTGIFSGSVITDSSSYQLTITVDENGGIKTQNSYDCGNSKPVFPTFFEDGLLKYNMNFDEGSWFDRNYLGACLSPASVVLKHKSEAEWSYEATQGGKTTSGSLTFQCTKECNIGSKCNSFYLAENNGSGFGACEALQSLDAWNKHVNEGTTCPLSNIASATTSDLRTTILEISRTLDSMTCLTDSDCSADTITDSLPTLMLQGQQILSVPAQSKSDTTEMTIQRQEDDVIISYTYKNNGSSVCAETILTIRNDKGAILGEEFPVSSRSEPVCADICFGYIDYNLYYQVSAKEGVPSDASTNDSNNIFNRE